MRRTKILITVGPASEPFLPELALRADGFRLNFSHGTDDDHRRVLRRCRTAARSSRRQVAVVADLQGPKLRLGELTASPWTLREGETLTLVRGREAGEGRRAPVELPSFPDAARKGDPVLLGDGQVSLRVEEVGREEIDTRVVQGGTLSSHAGVFLPRAHLRTEILGEKDLHDLGVALEEGVDYVALSFVRDRRDVARARREIARRKPTEASGIIAKIERAEALAHFDEILEESDGIMVARGDLGIEVPLERLAMEQKSLLRRTRAAGKFSIVATQMLLSMVREPRPTRAEATDVANAILDGTDALMLSEESAVGKFPREAVDWLDRIARATEPALPAGPAPVGRPGRHPSVESSVAEAAFELSERLGTSAIVTPTHSGRTARLVAAFRPRCAVVAPTARPSVERRLQLVWGVLPVAAPSRLPLEKLRGWTQKAVDSLLGAGANGPIVLTAGYPVEGRPTNLLTVIERVNSREPARRSR